MERNKQVVIVDLNGNDVAMEHDPPSTYQAFVGAGGDRAVWLETDGSLRALHPDGRVEQLAHLPLPGVWGGEVVLSPDGTQWAWDEATGANGLVHSRLLLGGDGRSPRLIKELTASTIGLLPFRWDNAGLVVNAGTEGPTGEIQFGPARGSMEIIDPQQGVITGRIRPPAGCDFAARALDGRVACWSDLNHDASLIVLKSDGSQFKIPDSSMGFDIVGPVVFRPGRTSTTALAGGASGEMLNNHPHAALVSTSSGSFSAFGPQGSWPAPGDWAWLADGSVILFRPQMAPGVTEEAYIVAADGTVRQLTAGLPFGVLT